MLTFQLTLGGTSIIWDWRVKSWFIPTITHVGQFASLACQFVPQTEVAGEVSDAHQKLSLLSLPFLSNYKRFILNYVCNLHIADALACLNEKKLYNFF